MSVRYVERDGYGDMTEQMARESLRFSSGLVYGVIIGAVIVWYTANLLNKAAKRRARMAAMKRD